MQAHHTESQPGPFFLEPIHGLVFSDPDLGQTQHQLHRVMGRFERHDAHEELGTAP